MQSVLQKIIALTILISILPVLAVFYLFVKLTSKAPFIFKQKRLGKNKQIFTMYKIRTMLENAEMLKRKYAHLNEVEDPVFKIYNDPRYTRIGKFLAHTGLDELPQLINVIKGDMALVGPRPLPIDEAEKIPSRYVNRFSVLPGMTSLWIIKGAHDISFNEWMRLDLEYAQHKSFWYDVVILLQTIKLVVILAFKKSYELLQTTS